MTVELKDITFRHVAIMLASALHVEGEEFREHVEANLEAIKALPAEQKNALKMAYIFSRKVPREEREDVFQDIATTLVEHGTSETRLAYAIARCDWQNWWKKFKIRQHYSLDSVTDDGEGNPVTLGELLVGESEFELKMDGKLDAYRIWQLIPDRLKVVVRQRLLGQMVSPFDAMELREWANRHAMYLA